MNSNLRYFDPRPNEARTVAADFCVYGGTSGGVTGAVEAARRGLRVVVVMPESHPGGLTSGGLGRTDMGKKEAIGGLAREFYRRAGRHYGVEEEWYFEPHVAERVFEEWLAQDNIQVFRREYLEAVEMEDGRITALRTISGLTVRARMFLDATYEGDLLARAGVRYAVGRESNSVYGETLNGQQIRDKHQFDPPVDPYVVAGVPSSGLLPGIETTPYRQGEGDGRVQAYNFRMCLTKRADIRVPFAKPANYRAELYILLKRFLATGWSESFRKFDPVRNEKTDTNNNGAVSTDFIGANHAYPEADYVRREEIFQDHVNYQQGLMWCLANDPGVPAAIRESMSQWGVCEDEFVDTGGWPFALYIREGRRMVSDYVMTELNCTGQRVAEDSIGLAAYGMDSHNCRRLVVDGVLRNEGDVQVWVQPYPMSYRSIIPARGQCRNLLVTFAVSASHIGFGSIRMEPVFMGLSQAAAIAAAMPKVAAGAVPWHQDKSYWPGANANPVITVWISMVDSTLENGCLHVWPRTHRKEVLSFHAETYSGTGFTEIDSIHLEGAREIALPVKAGSAILFNDRNIHRSTPNNSTGVRWSCDLRYQPTDQDPMPQHGVGFLARSRKYPERVATLEDWLQRRPEHLT